MLADAVTFLLNCLSNQISQQKWYIAIAAFFFCGTIMELRGKGVENVYALS